MQFRREFQTDDSLERKLGRKQQRPPFPRAKIDEREFLKGDVEVGKDKLEALRFNGRIVNSFNPVRA